MRHSGTRKYLIGFGVQYSECIGGHLEDSPVKTMDAVERRMPKSKTAWVNIIANRCRGRLRRVVWAL